MRAAMEREADAACNLLARREELAVAAEVVNAQSFDAQLRDEMRQCCDIQDLLRNKMMALQLRRIVRFSGNIHAPEWQLSPLVS